MHVTVNANKICGPKSEKVGLTLLLGGESIGGYQLTLTFSNLQLYVHLNFSINMAFGNYLKRPVVKHWCFGQIEASSYTLAN